MHYVGDGDKHIGFYLDVGFFNHVFFYVFHGHNTDGREADKDTCDYYNF